MSDDRSQRNVMMVFAAVLIAAVVAALVTTLKHVDTGPARTEAQPGTIGMARPHPPIDKAPGEAIRN
jgi:hypothetical protein